jgi:hypothetical protein
MRTSLVFAFAALFVAAILIGCSNNEPAVSGTAAPTGDVAGLDSAFEVQDAAADPTADLPTDADLNNAVN